MAGYTAIPQQLRETEGRLPGNYFKAMGYDYLYVKDGNDVEQLIEAFREVKDKKHPVVVHINTLKGRGYKLAEEQKNVSITVFRSTWKPAI